MGDLHSHAVKFLRGPRIISEPGATLGELIQRYVEGKPWDDPALRNQLSHYLEIAPTEAARHEGMDGPGRDAWAFYKNAAAILRDIQSEVLEEPGS